MRHLLVTVLLLLLPVTADADVVDVSFPMAAKVTISVAGTVPLAAGDLVIDDTFVLTGTGTAHFFSALGVGAFVLGEEDATFDVSGGGVSAAGVARVVETRETFTREAELHLVTSLYELGFAVGAFGSVSVDTTAREVSFSGTSEDVGVTVGGETASLVGMASFSGTGFVPEPGTAVLLVLGATAMAVWRGRGKIAGA
jgi:hypothetical protein